MSVDLSDPHIATAYEDIRNKNIDWYAFAHEELLEHAKFAQVALDIWTGIRVSCCRLFFLNPEQTRDKLSLLTSGTGGVEELVKSLPEDDVFFGFCREEEKDRSYFVSLSISPHILLSISQAIISIVPESVSGVRRGLHSSLSPVTTEISQLARSSTRGP